VLREQNEIKIELARAKRDEGILPPRGDPSSLARASKRRI